MRRGPVSKRYVTLVSAWPQFRHAPQMAQAAEYAYVMGTEAFERQARFRGVTAHDRKWQVKVTVVRRLDRERKAQEPLPPGETLLVA